MSKATDSTESSDSVLYVDIGADMKEILRAYSERMGQPFNFITKSALKSYLRHMCQTNEELDDVRKLIEEKYGENR